MDVGTCAAPRGSFTSSTIVAVRASSTNNSMASTIRRRASSIVRLCLWHPRTPRSEATHQPDSNRPGLSEGPGRSRPGASKALGLRPPVRRVESFCLDQNVQFPGSAASIRRAASAGMSWTTIVRASTTASSFLMLCTWSPPGSTNPIPCVYTCGLHLRSSPS